MDVNYDTTEDNTTAAANHSTHDTNVQYKPT